MKSRLNHGGSTEVFWELTAPVTVWRACAGQPEGSEVGAQPRTPLKTPGTESPCSQGAGALPSAQTCVSDHRARPS